MSDEADGAVGADDRNVSATAADSASGETSDCVGALTSAIIRTVPSPRDAISAVSRITLPLTKRFITAGVKPEEVTSSTV